MKKYSQKIKDLKKKTRDREIKIKLNLFLLAIKLKSVTEACERRGFSRSFYYKWWNRMLKSKFKLESLAEKSRRPKNSPNITPKKIEKRIKKISRKGYGGRMISGLFYREGKKISSSTICHILNDRKKVKKKRRQKLKAHRKRYELPIPGQRLQLDVKYVPKLVAGQKLYNYVIVDECTRWRFAKSYIALNEHITLDFLNRVKEEIPFPIRSIQTDNGFEFTYKLIPNVTKEHLMDKWCRTYGIIHRLIPPGEKELNGKVERSHRIDEQYFFWRMPTASIKAYERSHSEWMKIYNYERPHGGLIYKTPMEKLNERIENLANEAVDEKLLAFKLNFLKHAPNMLLKRDRQLTKLVSKLERLLNAA